MTLFLICSSFLDSLEEVPADVCLKLVTKNLFNLNYLSMATGAA